MDSPAQTSPGRDGTQHASDATGSNDGSGRDRASPAPGVNHGDLRRQQSQPGNDRGGSEADSWDDLTTSQTVLGAGKRAREYNVRAKFICILF